MTFTLCMALLVVAMICHWRGDERRAMGFTAGGLVLMLLIGWGLVARVALPLTMASNRLADIRWQDRNTIVLLGGGSFSGLGSLPPAVHLTGYGRIITTASAYFACRAAGHDCAIVVSGGDPQHHGATEASLYAPLLVQLGVPATAVTLEDRSLNTWQNAQNAARLIPADRQIVVVTSGLHLKRALMLFRHLRPGIAGLSADPVRPELSLMPTALNFAITDMIAHELVGIAQFRIYTALGLRH